MSGTSDQRVAEAWIGDAVLSLYVRSLIIRETGRIDHDSFVRMTSNHFLSGIGEPTRVEAEIGRVYQMEGLQAAFEWIERVIVPLARRQEQKRQPTPRRAPKI